MAHFAEIDSNGVVQRVIVVSNNDTADANGNEIEAIGVAFCKNLLGGNWVQTSYNANMRKNYASVGYTYRSDIDAFIPPQPFPSWLLNIETAQWEPPIPIPQERKLFRWNEEAQRWD